MSDDKDVTEQREAAPGPEANAEPWAELKHAIRAYITLTQGPSDALCVRLLKLPDFYDDLREGRDSSSEMVDLAHAMVRELGEGVLRRGEQLRNRPGLVDPVRRLRHCLESTRGAPKLDAKRAILRDVELMLRSLQEITGEKYPSVPA